MNRTLCRYTIIVLAPIFLTCPHVWADWWSLPEDRGYYNPLIAEIRSANINVMFPGWSNEFPFMQKDGNRLVWDISLGKEIPIVGFNTLTDPRDSWLKGNWGVGFWIPISFHMIEDFKDPSNPIVNTDYRFSFMFKGQYAFAKSKQFGVRLQLGHESTHLGDEFTIAAQDSSPDFMRVNVSYEYWELGLSFDWISCDSKYDTFSLRLGVIGLWNPDICSLDLWNPDKGFYSDTLMFPEGQTVSPSIRNCEVMIGFEHINHHTVTNKCGGTWKPFFSVELRHRTVYDYNKASSEQEEDKQWSVNLLAGLKITELASPASLASLLPGVYFRVYHGVNPHGQFRNQKIYTLCGIGLHFSRW